MVPKGTASSTKRKPSSKSDRPHKQQKVSLEPVIGLMAEGVKTVTPVKHGSGKGLMKAPSTNQEKPPPLLRDDSKFALEKLSSIISSEDYEDLGNHSTEAMGETGLFAVAQVIFVHQLKSVYLVFCLTLFNLFVPVLDHDEGLNGSVDRCLNREAALERV